MRDELNTEFDWAAFYGGVFVIPIVFGLVAWAVVDEIVTKGLTVILWDSIVVVGVALYCIYILVGLLLLIGSIIRNIQLIYLMARK